MLRMAHHVLLAQGKSIQAIRAGVPGESKVGTAMVSAITMPATDSAEDIEAARRKADQIRSEVKQRVETLGRAGLVLCPAYDVDEPDIPWENVTAFLDAVAEYG